MLPANGSNTVRQDEASQIFFERVMLGFLPLHSLQRDFFFRASQKDPKRLQAVVSTLSPGAPHSGPEERLLGGHRAGTEGLRFSIRRRKSLYRVTSEWIR
jgi:hypothetical protein